MNTNAIFNKPSNPLEDKYRKFFDDMAFEDSEIEKRQGIKASIREQAVKMIEKDLTDETITETEAQELRVGLGIVI